MSDNLYNFHPQFVTNIYEKLKNSEIYKIGIIDTIIIKDNISQVSNENIKSDSLIENWQFSNKDNLIKRKNKSNLTFPNIVERAEAILKEFTNKKLNIHKFSTEKEDIIELNFKEQLMPTQTSVTNFKKLTEDGEIPRLVFHNQLRQIRILRPLGYGHSFSKLNISNLVRYSYKYKNQISNISQCEDNTYGINDFELETKILKITSMVVKIICEYFSDSSFDLMDLEQIIDHRYNLYFSRLREVSLIEHDPLRNIEDLFDNLEFTDEETNNVTLDKVNFTRKDTLKHMKFYNFFDKSRDVLQEVNDERNLMATQTQFDPGYHKTISQAHMKHQDEEGFDEMGANIFNINSQVNKNNDVKFLDQKKQKKLQMMKQASGNLQGMHSVDILNAVNGGVNALRNDLPPIQSSQNFQPSNLLNSNSSQKLSYFRDVKKSMQVSSKDIVRLDSLASLPSMEIDRKAHEVKEFKEQFKTRKSEQIRSVRSLVTMRTEGYEVPEMVNKSVSKTDFEASHGESSQLPTVKAKDLVSMKNFNDVVYIPNAQNSNSPSGAATYQHGSKGNLFNQNQVQGTNKERENMSENKMASSMKERQINTGETEEKEEEQIVFEHQGQPSQNKQAYNFNFTNPNSPYLESEEKLSAVQKHKDKSMPAKENKAYSSGIFFNPPAVNQRVDNAFQNLSCKGIFCKLKETHNTYSKQHDFSKDAQLSVHKNQIKNEIYLKLISKVEDAMEIENSETQRYKKQTKEEEIDPSDPNQVMQHRHKTEREFLNLKVKLCSKCFGIQSKIQEQHYNNIVL